MKKENRIKKLAELQYIWLGKFLKPLFDNLTHENLRKYKKIVSHNRNKKFSELDSSTQDIYLEFAEETIRKI